jgi:hypothetical protein
MDGWSRHCDSRIDIESAPPVGDFMHAELILRALFLADFITNWGLGWRYLLSRKFRGRVHEKWSRRSKPAVIRDVLFAAVAFILFNGFIVLVCMWLYDGIVAPRLRS